MRNKMFGRLLKGAIGSIAVYEGKTSPIIEAELGNQIGLSSATIQRYKAGYLPPELNTVEILAEAAVKRGYLNREWLQAFLRAAAYPAPEKLTDKLCPVVSAHPRPAHVYQNLPPPTYCEFVMREQAYADVVDGICQRSSIVLITSLAGMGKTSLAREVAARCLQDNSGVPRFDAVIWVSDKDRPGTTTLNSVLDETARTLDYPGFIQFDFEEKRREVEHLLRCQRVLLVVDNFETITDASLLAWLLRLPEPSKALVTTREYSRAFRNSTFVIDLHGMNEVEAQKFIAQRLRMLRNKNLVSDPSQLAPLVAATGGNPKAIEIALGILSYQHRPLPQVIDDIYAARGELFDDLFMRSWALLSETAQRVLMSMPLFPASANCDALASTAGIQGFVFESAVERLSDLALLDIHQPDLNSPPRYTVHPLVRAFAQARLEKQPGFMSEARERWVKWCVQLASQVGYCWDDLSKLEVLDAEQETVHSVATWTLQNQHYSEALEIAKGIGYYDFIRGLWEKTQSPNLIAAEAARNLSDPVEEIEAIAYLVQVLCRQGNIAEAEKYLPQLRELTEPRKPSADLFFLVQHAIALYWMARGDLNAAQQAWQKSLDQAEHVSAHFYAHNRQWLATCLYRKGRLCEAQQLFRSARQDAVRIGLQQCVIDCTVKLAAIDLDYGNLEAAAALLEDSRIEAYGYQDRSAIAEVRHLIARSEVLGGNIAMARTSLMEAIDIFERLGMRRERDACHDELAHLDI